MKFLIPLLFLLSGCSIELSHTDTYEYALPDCSQQTLASKDFVTYIYDNGDAIYVSRRGDGYLCVKRNR